MIFTFPFSLSGLNQAVTQMVAFESTNKLNEELVSSKKPSENKTLIATAGDSKSIQFIFVDSNNNNNRSNNNDNNENDEKKKSEKEEEKDQTKQSSSLRIETVDSLKLEHGFKINCLRYSGSGSGGGGGDARNAHRLFVSDTTQNLTIYDFNNSCFL